MAQADANMLMWRRLPVRHVHGGSSPRRHTLAAAEDDMRGAAMGGGVELGRKEES